MDDCPNIAVRDALPDLLHASAGDPALADARAHLATCATCRAELELLRAVRGAAPSPRLHLDRVAAALPSYRPAPAWRRAAGAARELRVAAAVLLLVGAAVAGYVRSQAVRPDTMLAQVPAAVPAEVAIGEPFSDLSDSDLVALIEEMDQLEAEMPMETDVVEVPGVERGGGDQ